MPDIYIPIDKKDPLNLFNKLANNGILYQYAFEYTDRYRVSLASFKSYLDFDKKFVFPEASLKDLLTYAAKNGVTIESNQVAASKEEIQLYCKALIARNLYDDMGFYTIYNRTDKTIIKAIEALK